MPDIFELFSRWWKQIAIVVLAATIAAIVLVFTKTPEYLSTATAIASTSVSTDKSRIFGENIQTLYSPIGSPDDLDLIIGTSRLDTVYEYLVSKYDLQSHYKIKSDPAGNKKAALILQDKSKVTRSDFGELKVKVWDKEPAMAAMLANALIEKLQQFHLDLRNISNLTLLDNIKQDADAKRAQLRILKDSVQTLGYGHPEADIIITKTNALVQQLIQYEKMISEYELTVKASPQPFMIIEHAKPALKPDKPQKLKTIIAAIIIGFIFAFLTALVLERRRSTP